MTISALKRASQLDTSDNSGRLPVDVVRRMGKKYNSYQNALMHCGAKLVKDLKRAQDSSEKEAISKSLGFQGLFADSIQPSQYPATNFVPYQFLTNLDPNYIANLMLKLVGEEVLGSRIFGDWFDESVIFQAIEHQANPQLYTIGSNIATSDVNINFEERNVVRIQLAMMGNQLGIQRVSKINLDLVAELRKAAMRGIALRLDQITFNGFDDGGNKTYGLLNDPLLFPTFPLAFGDWTSPTATFATITADIRSMAQELLTRSLNNVDAEQEPTTLAVASDSYSALAYATDFGMSVRKYISDTYPMMDVIAVPRFNQAIGGLNAVYLMADSFNDGYSPNSEVISNIYQSKFRVMGNSIEYTGTVRESYMAATSGVTVRRPQLVVNAAGC